MKLQNLFYDKRKINLKTDEVEYKIVYSEM